MGLRGRVWRRSENAWQVIIVKGHRADGNEQRDYYTRSTEAEARQLLHQKMHELYQGTYTEPHKLTLAAFARQWLADYAELNLKPTTVDNYRGSLERHALPEIGEVKLTALRPPHIQRVLAAAHRKGLAPKTVKHVYTALHRVLGQAVTWGLLQRSPAASVAAPKVPRSHLPFWTAAEAQAFLDAVRPHRLGPLYHVALATGMRRGELIGLRWEDVDLDGGRLTVRGNVVEARGKGAVWLEPKTRAGVRTITLGDKTVAVLRAHELAQRKEYLRHGLRPRVGAVFASEVGGWLPATTLRRVFVQYIAKAAVPHIPFHGLRHTHATLLLSAGVHPKVVAERLGHADVGITLNTYAHILPNLQREAAAATDALLH